MVVNSGCHRFVSAVMRWRWSSSSVMAVAVRVEGAYRVVDVVVEVDTVSSLAFAVCG